MIRNLRGFGREVDVNLDLFLDVGHVGHIGDDQIVIGPVDDGAGRAGELRFGFGRGLN